MSENETKRVPGEIQFSYGGQAVIEGVLMRGANDFAVVNSAMSEVRTFVRTSAAERYNLVVLQVRHAHTLVNGLQRIHR